MPARLIDNMLADDVKISITKWEKIENDPDGLAFLIDATFKDAPVQRDILKALELDGYTTDRGAGPTCVVAVIRNAPSARPNGTRDDLGSFPRPPEVPTEVSNGVQMYLVALGCSDTSSQPCTMSLHVFLKTKRGTGPSGTREHLTHNITELVYVLLEGSRELCFLGGNCVCFVRFTACNSHSRIGNSKSWGTDGGP